MIVKFIRDHEIDHVEARLIKFELPYVYITTIYNMQMVCEAREIACIYNKQKK